MMSNRDGKDYSDLAISLAYEAGKLMRKNLALGMKKTFKKSDKSPLTVSDIRINRMVIDKINKIFPKHSIIGEEKISRRKSEYTWLCDPIDGTIPFSSGIPISTFSLALTKDGVPLLGVIYDPFMDRMFVGKKGKGAFLNNKRIWVSANKETKDQTLYMGWWKYSLYDLLLVRKALSKKGCKIMDFCSFAYAGALVAAGEFGGLLYADRYPWDVAAIQVLVEEAGGRCTDFEGKNLNYNEGVKGFIASNGEIHKELLILVKKFAAPNGKHAL